MAQGILSVKIRELEEQFSRLSGRIQLSETADHLRLRREIEALSRECDRGELTMDRTLRYSHGKTASILADAYRETEKSARKARAALAGQTCGEGTEAAVEEKILLAEYALDFALQAANRALLRAMEAIDAQYTGQEGDKPSL